MNGSKEDEGLLAELRDALGEVDPVPPELVSGAKAAYLARNLDEELAELIFDSERDEAPMLTRGAALRALSFATGEISAELELNSDQSRILGQLVPPATADIDLEFEGLVVDSTRSDDLGRFRFDDVPSGSISIVCRADPASTWGICKLVFDF